MKWNWGTGIAATYTAFVVFMIFMVVRSTQNNHFLVTDNYYKKDLEYQTHYDKLVNANELEQDLQISYQGDESELLLTFPASLPSITGQVLLFRPSDDKQDLTFDISPDPENLFHIGTASLGKGLWKVKVDWQAGGKSYYKEESIVF